MAEQTHNPFLVKDCALTTIALGQTAASLTEFRDKLHIIPTECIYYHFWGARLRPQFIPSEYHNDFAAWAHHKLHDQYLAERLGVIDPTEYDDLENLRFDLIEIVETGVFDVRPGQQDALFILGVGVL